MFNSTPCPLPCLPSSPRGLASNEKYRFIFNKASSVNTDSVLDQERQEFSRAEPVLPVEFENQPKTVELENGPLDPGKLQQSQANLSLRHRLVLVQPHLKKGYRLRLPVPLVGPEMEAIQLVIAKAFQGRPSDVVEPGQPFTLADTVGHFWESKVLRLCLSNCDRCSTRPFRKKNERFSCARASFSLWIQIVSCGGTSVGRQRGARTGSAKW